LKKYQEQDPRIKVIFRTENGNISAASNTALEIATGEYICLLDHDDELAIDALFEVAKLIVEHPDADFIYTDEDHIDARNNHFDPAFKSGWSPDLFHTQMYTCHLGVYRTKLVREIGGFRSEYDGAQDYDLVLRLTEKTQNIYHLSKILYHWRSIATSSASGLSGKPWAFQVGKKALEAMLERSPYPGYVEETKMPGVFRVRRHLQGQPLVSIVIPSAGKIVNSQTGQICLLEQCIQSLNEKSSYRNFEIIVVDGYDISEETLSRLNSSVQLVRERQPFNYSRRINLGAAKARGDILLLLNDDTQILTPDWLESMLEFAQQEEIGAVGAKLLFPDGKIQHTGVVLVRDTLGNFCPTHVFYGYDSSHTGYSFSNIVNRNYLAVTAACLMVRKSVFIEVGGMAEEFPLNFNDVDFCLKLHRAGYRNVFTPYAQLSHYGSASRSDSKVGRKEQEYFSQKWDNYLIELGGDPYYHPNFGSSPNFELEA
jgi:GT2 family glycosyltransferase